MAKRTIQKKSPSGIESLLVSNSFIYEISLYKIFKDRVELAGSQLYSSKEKLIISKDTLYTKEKDYILMKCIDWIAAPKNFIEENHLNITESCRKTQKRKKV